MCDCDKYWRSRSMVALRECFRKVLQNGIFIFNLQQTNRSECWQWAIWWHRQTYDDVGFKFSGDHRILMDFASNSDVRLSIGEDFAVELTLFFGKTGGLWIWLHYWQESPIYTSSSTSFSRYVFLVRLVWSETKALRSRFLVVERKGWRCWWYHTILTAFPSPSRGFIWFRGCCARSRQPRHLDQECCFSVCVNLSPLRKNYEGSQCDPNPRCRKALWASRSKVR